MNHELFSRNWLFINDTLQAEMKKRSVLLCGTGMGSQILITLVRLGFKKFTVSDGDTVSLGNLNRQHFFQKDINQNKAETIVKYAKEINPEIEIKVVSKFLKNKDLEELIPNHDFIINCIDLDSPEFIDCHLICKAHDKLEIFPVNLGFGTGILISESSCPDFLSYFKCTPHDLKMHLLNHLINHNESSDFIKEKFKEYLLEKKEYDPQNIISTLMTSAVISTIIIKILNKEEIRTFPKINYLEFKP